MKLTLEFNSRWMSQIFTVQDIISKREDLKVYIFLVEKSAKNFFKKYFVNQPLKLGIPCYVCTTIFKHIIGNVNLKRHSQEAEPLNSNKNHNILFVSVTIESPHQK